MQVRGRAVWLAACGLVAAGGCGSKGKPQGDGPAASAASALPSAPTAALPEPPPVQNYGLPGEVKRVGPPVLGETHVKYVLIGFSEDGLVALAKDLHARWPEVRHDLYLSRVDPKKQVGQVYKKLLSDKPGELPRPVWVFQYDVRGGVLDGDDTTLRLE